MSRVEVLGVGVDPISKDALLDRVERAVAAGAPMTIAYANAHVLALARHDAALQQFLNRADLCYCDGNGVRLAAQLLGEELPHRMTGADWIWDLAARAEGRWRLYWLGGEPGVTARAAAAMVARHPRLEIGTDHGFHAREGEEDRQVLARIAAARPDIVLVGMGTPIQERWVAERRAQIAAPVVWCVGATADFVSGKVRRGPRWLTDRAEWLDRLYSEPGRLWRRYLLENAAFFSAVLAQRLRGAR